MPTSTTTAHRARSISAPLRQRVRTRREAKIQKSSGRSRFAAPAGGAGARRQTAPFVRRTSLDLAPAHRQDNGRSCVGHCFSREQRERHAARLTSSTTTYHRAAYGEAGAGAPRKAPQPVESPQRVPLPGSQSGAAMAVRSLRVPTTMSSRLTIVCVAKKDTAEGRRARRRASRVDLIIDHHRSLGPTSPKPC